MRARLLFFIIAAAIATLPLTGCGGGGGGPTVTVNSFSQADLAGTWNIIIFASGPEVSAVPQTQPGWTRGAVTVDTSGLLTFTALTANAPFGSIPLPAPGAAIWTMDANGNGVVTSGGAGGGLLGMQGFMAANKQVIVGTLSVTANSRAMVIAVKQATGVTFSSTDVTGPMSFTSHLLRSGASTDWDFFTGTIDSSSQVTFTSYITITGPVVPLPVTNVGTITNNSTGLVHLLSEPTFEGVMTPDKKVIFATFTDTDTTTGANIYHLDVIMLGGQTFAMSDLAGFWRYQTLASSLTPLWEFGIFSIAGTGIGTQLSLTDSNGNTTVPPSFAFTINASGNVANPADPSLFGTMAFNKQMIVSTNTRSAGVFGLSIALKK
jgi:hypothetical protein